MKKPALQFKNNVFYAGKSKDGGSFRHIYAGLSQLSMCLRKEDPIYKLEISIDKDQTKPKKVEAPSVKDEYWGWLDFKKKELEWKIIERKIGV